MSVKAYQGLKVDVALADCDEELDHGELALTTSEVQGGLINVVLDLEVRLRVAHKVLEELFMAVLSAYMEHGVARLGVMMK